MKKQFSLYTLIGIANTALHWLVFAALFAIEFTQASANLAGFLAASLFSFIVNSKVTFKTELHLGRYIVYMLGMASISYGVGYLGDALLWHPLITLVLFSFLSLVIGFLWSKFVVFRN